MVRRGWYGQSFRHSLAARGVRTTSKYLAKKFDISQIEGRWVQKSVKPNDPPFQKGCEKVEAKYTARPDGSVRVENTCVKDGKKRSIVGKAKKVGEKELSVDFFPGIPFTAGEFKIKRFTGDKMTVQGGKYTWELKRK